MSRLVTVSFTALDAGGGVPKFNRDLHAAFQDRECVHFCWDDYPFSDRIDMVNLPEWEKARLLNHWLVSRRNVTREDVIVADGFWAAGLESFPYAISHSHGIWGHITKEDADAGKLPENPLHHAAQVEFRRRWIKFGKRITAVSDFIAEQMRIQWGFAVDRVIDNGVDVEEFRPAGEGLRCPSSRPVLVHGINDRGNINKGWDHIEPLANALDAEVLSLDDLCWRWKFSGQTKAKTLAGAAMMVHPSGYEGNSMFVAEALACGLPIVGYNVGFAWRLWRDAGGRCLTVGEILDRRERSPQATADACRRVLARIAAGERFDSRHVAERQLSIEKFRSSWRSYVQDVEDGAYDP